MEAEEVGPLPQRSSLCAEHLVGSAEANRSANRRIANCFDSIGRRLFPYHCAGSAPVLPARFRRLLRSTNISSRPLGEWRHPLPSRARKAPLLESSVQYRASGVRRKGQAVGRSRRRRPRDRGTFQLGRAVIIALIIIVLVLVILRLLDIY